MQSKQNCVHANFIIGKTYEIIKEERVGFKINEFCKKRQKVKEKFATRDFTD